VKPKIKSSSLNHSIRNSLLFLYEIDPQSFMLFDPMMSKRGKTTKGLIDRTSSSIDLVKGNYGDFLDPEQVPFYLQLANGF